MKHISPYFLAAIISFTRLPLGSQQLAAEHFARALQYLPGAGLLIGLMTALVYWLANGLATPLLASFFALLAGILLTGALHEDGFADCCDGFGAGGDADNILRIMKDSATGVYATLGLIILLGGKLLLFNEMLAEKHILALIAMHVLARFIPLFIVVNSAPASQSQAKMSAGLHVCRTKLLASFAVSLAISLLFLPFLLVLLLAASVLLTSVWACRMLQRRLGGYNGDSLGGAEQLGEFLILLLFALYF